MNLMKWKLLTLCLLVSGCLVTTAGCDTLNQQQLDLVVGYVKTTNDFLVFDDAAWEIVKKKVDDTFAAVDERLLQAWVSVDQASIYEDIKATGTVSPVELTDSVRKLLAAQKAVENERLKWAHICSQREQAVSTLRAASALTEKNAVALKEARESLQAAARAVAELLGTVTSIAVTAAVAG